ncbi:MAG: ECF-type sigma factor [Planctomycetota bacterium]
MSESNEDPRAAHDPIAEPEAGEATALLARLESGESGASEALLPLVYDQLRSIAASYFRRERRDHTLEPTALVHEAYLKLIRAENQGWRGRSHFAAVASRAMRQILQNHAEAKVALKRGGDGQRVPLDNMTIVNPGVGAVDVVELSDSLTKLAAADERQAQIVEMKFFTELSNEQIAEVLDVSSRTVERSWRSARAWLNSELSNSSE